MDAQQLKADNCKLRIKCLFAECLINPMGQLSWETTVLHFFISSAPDSAFLKCALAKYKLL